MMLIGQIRFRSVVWFIGLIVCGSLLVREGSAATEASQPSSELVKLEAEVLEVEALKEPLGSAIYTVKNLETGETVQLFAHPYRSTIHSSGQVTAVTDILGGMKVTVIYRAGSARGRPEVVFGKVTSSYYG